MSPQLSYAEVVARPQQIFAMAPLSYAEVINRPQLSPSVTHTYDNVMARPQLLPTMQSLHQPPCSKCPVTLMGPATANS